MSSNFSIFSNTFLNTSSPGALSPSNFFDLASFKTPEDLKMIFPFLEYCSTMDGVISTIVSKISSYTCMPLEYSKIKNESDVEALKSLMEESLDIKNSSIHMLKDFNTYGSSFASVVFPFKRYFTCTKCQGVVMSDFITTYRYEGGNFYFKCPKCSDYAKPKSYDDFYYKNCDKTKIKVWRPHDIDIVSAPFSSENRYFYTPPPEVIRMINSGDKFILDNTPKFILESLRKGDKILFSDGTLFHMKRPSISKSSIANSNWGEPLIISCLPNVILKKLFYKMTEVTSTIRAAPATIVYPETNASGGEHGNPLMATQMANFQRHMQSELTKHRRDPGYLMMMAHPIGAQNLFGDSKNFNFYQEMKYQDEMSIISTGTPREFIEGGLQFQSSSIPLRMLENQLLSQYQETNKFISWVKRRLSSFFELPKEDISMKRFRVADDLAMLQIQLQAAANGDLSKKRIWESTTLDISYEDEQELVLQEDKSKFKSTRERVILETKAQIEAQELMAKAQAKAQVQAQSAAMKEQASISNQDPDYAKFMEQQQQALAQEQQMKQQEILDRSLEIKERQQSRLEQNSDFSPNSELSQIEKASIKLRKIVDLISNGKLETQTFLEGINSKFPMIIDDLRRAIIYSMEVEEDSMKLKNLILADEIIERLQSNV